MQAIQATDERGFSATGRSNQSRGPIGCNVQTDVVQSLSLAVPRVQLFDLDAYTHKSVGSRESTMTHSNAYCSYGADNQDDQYQCPCPGLPVPFIKR
jgi:hypothetical protein